MSSKILDGFLSKKRVFQIPPVTPIEVSKDTFIKTFCESIDLHNSTTTFNNHDITSSISIKPSSKVDDIKIVPSVNALGGDDSSSSSSNIKFKVHNLLYRMTERELYDFITNYNIKVIKVEMGTDSTPQLPAGTAFAYISNEINASEVLSILNGEDCLGRPIRVSEISATNKNRESFGQTRYFDRDISIKCNNCGEVGHRQFECPNPLLESFCCHLCGGSHDPSECSSIICFRCNRFGHHSRFCDNNRALKDISVCTLCGLTSHSTSACAIFVSSERFPKGGRGGRGKRSENESEEIKTDLENTICMVCFETGHTCGCIRPDKKKMHVPVTKSNRESERRLFCPNCGESNHCVDFPSPGEYNQCRAAFYDAYGRFPELMNLLEDPFHGGARGRNTLDLYNSLTRYQSDKIVQMFPSLQQPTSVYVEEDYNKNSNYHSRHGNHHNAYGHTQQQSTKYHSEKFENKNQQGRKVSYSMESSFSSSSSSRHYGRDDQYSRQQDDNRGGHKRFRNNEDVSRDNSNSNSNSNSNTDHRPSTTYFNHQTDVNENSHRQNNKAGGQRGGREFVHKSSTSGNNNHKNSKLLNYNSNRR